MKKNIKIDVIPNAMTFNLYIDFDIEILILIFYKSLFSCTTNSIKNGMTSPSFGW